MEKKNLKWYEAPQVEVVEMEMQGMLCMSGDGGETNVPNLEDGD